MCAFSGMNIENYPVLNNIKENAVYLNLLINNKQ